MLVKNKEQLADINIKSNETAEVKLTLTTKIPKNVIKQPYTVMYNRFFFSNCYAIIRRYKRKKNKAYIYLYSDKI